MGFEGLKRIDMDSASAGNIVAVAGFADANIGETMPSGAAGATKVDEPTLQMTFSVNDSPLLGRKEILSPRQLRDRLMRELETNVALRVEEPILG